LDGGPAWSNLPGPYVIVGDGRSVEPEGIQAAPWASSYLGPENRGATDRINQMLMSTFGDQNIVTSLIDRVDISPVFFSSELGPDEIAILRQARIRYLVVDLRLSTALPLEGYYFESDEPDQGFRPFPFLRIKNRTEYVPGNTEKAFIVRFNISITQVVSNPDDTILINPFDTVNPLILTLLVQFDEGSNPYLYVVEYADGRRDLVNVASITCLADEPCATIDQDGSVQVISNRLSLAGALQLEQWLAIHKQDFIDRLAAQADSASTQDTEATSPDPWHYPLSGRPLE
jgi:hypothetical protein